MISDGLVVREHAFVSSGNKHIPVIGSNLHTGETHLLKKFCVDLVGYFSSSIDIPVSYAATQTKMVVAIDRCNRVNAIFRGS